jgi:hypothetical protein
LDLRRVLEARKMKDEGMKEGEREREDGDT